MQISALSTEYVRVPIQATEAGVVVNPVADVVQMAFVAEGAVPGVGDWKAASWEWDQVSFPNIFYVRCLVGPSPGVIVLTAGLSYDCYTKIADNPEVPVLKVGAVRVI